MYTNNKNRDYYPTPGKLIDKMLSGIDFDKIETILEPSAGSGNIVDALRQKEKIHNKYHRYEEYKFDIDCIEIDPNLQHILKGKEYRVVHNDFITYDTMKEYDLIIMNPPFSNGCKHLLKALEIQSRTGGAVICLLNAETIRNAYTNERIDLQRKLTEYNAEIEFIQDAFLDTDAERKTSVEIALIKVYIPKVQKESFIWEGLKKAQKEREYDAVESTQLIDSDLFKAIVNQYQLEVEAGTKLIKEYFAMQPLILSEFDKNKETGETIQKGNCILSLKVNNKEVSVNRYIREVRRKYWKALFQNPRFIG